MINNMIFLVSGVPNDSLAEFFAALRRNPDVAGYLQVPYNECEFHRLTSPASLARNGSEDDDTILARVTRACSDASNRIRLSPTITTVGELTDNGMFASNCVYLVIDFQDPQLESLNAIRQLRRDHGNLFTCLQVTASSVKAWHEEDVDRNLQGGEVTMDIGRLPREFRQIQDALDKKCVYHSTIYDLFSRRQDLASALKYRTQFDRVFKHGLPLYDVATVTSDAEFSAFYSVLRRVASDMSTILDKGTTSSVKSSIFTFCFVQPPFFFEIHDDSHGFRYKEEQSWSFPLFVDTPSMRDDWKTYTPRNDCMVVSPQHGIPFIISEVISDVKESDCWRMLVEASALARAGQFLLKSTSKKRFFIVALYVDANMVVSRYIVMQSGDNNVGHKLVSIYQKSFDLKKANEQADFMREMYNLTTQITALSGELDQDKRLSLRDIHAVAGNVPSLSSAPQKTRTTGSTTAERTAWTHGPQDEDNLGVFEADDIKNVLHQMNYKIEFVLRRVRVLVFSSIWTNLAIASSTCLDCE
ncbi:hypothetical protein OG21DRAFT_1018327 [Imleria badia]|nr:hypothetical protein OG21DRAFT_1018327 [Imleria badia]